VIPTDQANAAATALVGVDAATTALVGVYTAQSAAAIADSTRQHSHGVDPTWTGLHRGLVDPAWAEGSIRQVTARSEASDEKQSRLTDTREADRALLGDLTQLLDDCPAGHLDSLAGRISDLDRTLAGIGTALGQARVDLDQLDKDEAEDTATEQRTQ